MHYLNIMKNLHLNKQNVHIFLLVLIMLLGAFLRFYNTPFRYSLAGDTGRDALMAKEAVKQFQLPLTGSFSSLGPFTFGPWYYYILILSHLLIPSVWASWIAVGLISTTMILIMYKIGELLENKSFGLVVALLTTVSPFQVASGAMMIQHSLIGPLTALALYLFLEIWFKKHSSSFGILLGIAIGLAINMHYQAASFLALVFLFLLKKEKLVLFVTTFLGVFLTFFPLLFFELNNHWFNTRNIIRFFLYDQYRLWVPNRWLTYAFQFWPQFWSEVTGFPFILSFIFIAIFVLIFLIRTAKKENSFTWLVIAAHFILLVIIVRYWRGERYFGYLQFFHSYIFLFVGYVIWLAFNFSTRYHKHLGSGFLLIACLFGILKSREHLKSTFLTLEAMEKYQDLKSNYPHQKFSVYHCGQYDDQALSLTLYLEMQKSYDEEGRKIGIESVNCPVYEKDKSLKKPLVKKFPSAGLKILDLEEATIGALLQAKWRLISSKTVYDEVARWWFKLQP